MCKYSFASLRLIKQYGCNTCYSCRTYAYSGPGLDVVIFYVLRRFTALVAFGDVRGAAGLAFGALGGVGLYQAEDFPGVRASPRRLDLPEQRHLARERQRGVLRSGPEQSLPWDFMSPKERAQ